MIVESYEDVIVLSGALRANYWDTVHTAISLLLKRHPTGVIIDCSGLTECSDEGAETFRDIMSFIAQFEDARILVAAVPANVLETLKQVPEVRSQLAIAASVDEARKSLDLLVEEPTKGRKKVAQEIKTKIVLYLTGRPSDLEGLAAGERLAESLGAELELAYVVVVPRDLPITAALPKDEAIAAEAIASARAFFKEREVPYEAYLERGRDVASALAELCENIGAERLLIPLSNKPADADKDLNLVRSVTQKTKVWVGFIRPKV